MKIVSVHPVNDIIDHDIYSEYCGCEPKVEQWGIGILIIHNSHDRREFREEPIKKGWAVSEYKGE